MSIKMMNAVWEWDAKTECKGLRVDGGMVKYVAISLADHYNDKTKQCNPSQARIAERCSITKKSVSRAILALEQLGYLKVYRWRKRDGTKGKNEYTPLFMEMGRDPRSSGEEKVGTHGPLGWGPTVPITVKRTLNPYTIKNTPEEGREEEGGLEDAPF